MYCGFMSSHASVFSSFLCGDVFDVHHECYEYISNCQVNNGASFIKVLLIIVVFLQNTTIEYSSESFCASVHMEKCWLRMLPCIFN